MDDMLVMKLTDHYSLGGLCFIKKNDPFLLPVSQ